MKKRIIILKNGTRAEACNIFDACKNEISDFTKERVSVFGNIRNPNEGWSVIKTIF
jgi:hypothetical protein